MTTTTHRDLDIIAAEIRADWTNVYFGAVPYLDAMGRMLTVDEDYGCDPGYQIVTYFLANAQTWRGEVARNTKAELKAMLPW